MSVYSRHINLADVHNKRCLFIIPRDKIFFEEEMEMDSRDEEWMILLYRWMNLPTFTPILINTTIKMTMMTTPTSQTKTPSPTQQPVLTSLTHSTSNYKPSAAKNFTPSHPRKYNSNSNSPTFATFMTRSQSRWSLWVDGVGGGWEGGRIFWICLWLGKRLFMVKVGEG